MSEYLEILYNVWSALLVVAGSVTLALAVIGGATTAYAWSSKIIKPLWRLGLGLARKKIVIVSSHNECSSLTNLISESKIFDSKNVNEVCSREDSEDIKKADVVLFRYSGSPFTLEDVLSKKSDTAAVVIYARPGEIPKDSPDWDLMDEHRNISICNLKGRLLNDLLTLMMTTKL